jgi:hypothetical protein
LKTYNRVLFALTFLLTLTLPAFAQTGSTDNGGLNGGGAIPHSGIGKCPVGQAAVQLLPNAPPICSAFAGGGGINPGTQNDIAYYATTGSTVSPNIDTTDALGNMGVQGLLTVHNLQAVPGGPDVLLQLDPNNDSLLLLQTGGANVGWGLQAADSSTLGHGHFAQFELVSALWEPMICYGDGAGTFYNGGCVFNQPTNGETPALHLIRNTDTSPSATGTILDVETLGEAKLWSVDDVGTEHFWGSSSGNISLVPQAASGTYNWNWPTTAGTSGYCLASAGGGSSAMTWVQCLTGATSVTSVTGTTNQILASPTTGAVVLTLVGPYTPSSYTAHVPLLGEGTSSIGVGEGVGTNGQMFLGQTAADPAWETMSGDATLTQAGVITVTKINGTTPGGSCAAGLVVTSIDSHGVPTCTQKTDKFSCPIPAAATNNAILCDIPMPIAETVPVNCGASVGTSVVAATGSTTFTIKKITSGGSSTTIGTAVWSASGKTAAFTCASPVSFAATDLLEIDGPATGDTTLTQGGITISANAGAL